MSEELISAYDIRGNETTGLNVECAWNVGKALADWLPTNGTVLVAGRQAQAELTQAVIEGVRLQGRAVIDGGDLNKEQVIKQVEHKKLSGAVIVGFDDLANMTTLELYQDDAHLVTSETGLTTIRNLVEAGNFVPAAVKGELLSH